MVFASIITLVRNFPANLHLLRFIWHWGLHGGPCWSGFISVAPFIYLMPRIYYHFGSQPQCGRILLIFLLGYPEVHLCIEQTSPRTVLCHPLWLDLLVCWPLGPIAFLSLGLWGATDLTFARVGPWPPSEHQPIIYFLFLSLSFRHKRMPLSSFKTAFAVVGAFECH